MSTCSTRSGAGVVYCLVAVMLALCSAFSQPAAAQTLAFTNETVRAGLTFTHTQGPRYGFLGAGGVAADFNNDGYIDLFVLGGGGDPDALFINNGINQQGHVTFTDQAQQWGVNFRHHSFGVSAVDFNNDGFVDLYITSYGPVPGNPIAGRHKLLRNNGPDAEGNWSFTDIALAAGVHLLRPGLVDGTGSAWGDYDLDGDLDLFVASYQRGQPGNRLFRNDGLNAQGVWIFTDVTNVAGLHHTQIAGFIPGFVDMNGDGYPELLLVADSGTSKYYINNRNGTFTVATHLCNGIESANGMGSAIGDINADGRLDWYVSGSWYDFLQGPGNVLMVASPHGDFVNIAPGTPVQNGGWGWGVLIVDLDHDTRPDLVETNGWLGEYLGEQSYLLRNLGGLQFQEIALQVGFAHHGQGRGLIRFDADNDGDQDLVIFSCGEPLAFFENHLITPGGPTPTNANWINIKFDTRQRATVPPHGIGTVLQITAGGLTQTVHISSSFSHASQSEIGAHVGLGTATTIDILRIRYPDGSIRTYTNIPANQHLLIHTPAHRADFDGSGTLDVADVQAIVIAWQARDLAADHNGDWILDFFDILHFLRDFSN